MLALALAVGSALAISPSSERRNSEAGPASGAVTSVTDAAGNPIDLAPAAAGAKRLAEAAPHTTLRGQAWWPYARPLAPYTAVDTPVEAMTQDQIRINDVAILDIRNPRDALAAMPEDLVLDEGSQLRRTDGFYLLKIAGFSRTQEQIDALRSAGVILGEYLNINTYIARIPTSAYGAVRALPFVTYIGDYQPAYKISPRIGLEEIPETEAFDLSGRALPWVFEVVLHAGADPQDVFDGLARLGLFPMPEEIVSNEALTVLLVPSDPAVVPSLAKIPGVKWIAERTYPRLAASSASPATIPMLLQNNGTFTTLTSSGWKLWNAGIDGTASGSAQIITVLDTGLNTEMYHFSQDTASVGALGPSHRKVVGYDVDGGDQCVLDYTTADGGHGTWTSQHAVGSISNMTTNPDTTHTPTVNYDVGIARGAKIYFRDIGQSDGTIITPLDLGPGIATAIGKGSYIENNSWGAATPTYTTQASNLDTALFNNPNFVVTVASGNEGMSGAGTIRAPSTSKNCISVGGNDAANPGSLFIDCGWDGAPGCGAADLGSSRGPVSGAGRVKPDIMAYVAFNASVGGEREAGNRPHAMCQTDAAKPVYWDFVNINGFGGTSFAAPEVAGLAALVRDYFQAGFYPTGTATPANALTPSGSLVKAVILASGEDMTTAASPTSSIAITKRYGSDVGYGRVNLPGVLRLGNPAPFLWVQNNDALGQSATKTFFYTINGNSIPLRVMMAYYDSAGDALQKDCDLKVTIGANVYWGNNFSAGWSTTATTTRDHTNPTEGVFLDAAHGLPASGTVRVDVIGFNNPGGMNYSLAVSGNVASQAVTQVALDRGHDTCSQDVKITVDDAAASSPVSVTLTSRNSASTIIDTKVVSCSGASGVFTGTIHTGSGITVADGGTITATYGGAAPSAADIVCQLALTDAGSSIGGGCDNGAAGTDGVTGPLTNGGSNEFYTKYMDANEYSSYTVLFTNESGADLTDATVALSFTGAGASKMTVYNSPVHVGDVPAGKASGAVFQVYTDPTAAALSTVNLNFDVTSLGDGFTIAKRITQVQLLQANDIIARQNRCSTFTGSLSPWVEATVGSFATNPWRWSGAANTPSVVSSENRTDGLCGNSTANSAAMVGNSGLASGNNFNGSADSFLLQTFQPALTGNGPNGQPYHYAWRWHSFYHATETLGATTGVWGVFYNDKWNSPVAPTGDQAAAFPIYPNDGQYFYQTALDYVSGWNWETANTGTPDDPDLDATTVPPQAPNQLILTFDGVTGLATSSTYFAYGHEHADLALFGGSSSASTRRDIAIDNDDLVYDEYYASAQAGASCGAGGQVGVVAFNESAYAHCPTGSAVLSVLDPNAASPLTVTVSSPGTGDSEQVTLTGSPPYFSGTMPLSTVSGRGNNNGTLFVLPNETINAAYTDASPAGTSTATAATACAGGNVVYLSNAEVSDNGDNDGFADNGETVTMDVTIQNTLTTALTNTKVTISTDSPYIDCISDDHALYGTVAAGASATNPPGDRFTFHVAHTVACTDPLNPPTARFTVVITGDGLDGAAALQTFVLGLDLDPTNSGGPYTLTQNFNTDPGWFKSVTPPDNAGCNGNTYSNTFHWCAACGNGSGGYGAWIGNSPFGTLGQNYTEAYDSSTLYSPVLVANGNVTLRFDVAYRTEATYDAGIVQYKVGAGSWTDLAYTTPPQSATQSANNYCSPILLGATGWTGSGVNWTTTNAPTVTASSGQTIQFRWRLGSDVSTMGTGYGGYGIDNVTITNLKQTTTCEPTRNLALPGCVANCAASPNGTACDDANQCTQTDTCQAGVCSGSNPVPPPPEVNSSLHVTKSGSVATISWTDPSAPYGLYRGTRTSPSWSYNQTCLQVVNAGSSGNDAVSPSPGTTAYYLVTKKSPCGESIPGRNGFGTPIPNAHPCP